MLGTEPRAAGSGSKPWNQRAMLTPRTLCLLGQSSNEILILSLKRDSERILSGCRRALEEKVSEWNQRTAAARRKATTFTQTLTEIVLFGWTCADGRCHYQRFGFDLRQVQVKNVILFLLAKNNRWIKAQRDVFHHPHQIYWSAKGTIWTPKQD